MSGLVVAILFGGCGQRSEPAKSKTTAQELVRTILAARSTIGRVIAPSEALSIDLRGERLVASFADLGPSRAHMAGVRASLAAHADGAFSLEWKGTKIEVAIEGAAHVPAEIDSGIAVYRGAVAGQSLLHVPSVVGTEELVHYAVAPAERVLRHRVRMTGVAGLRKIGSVVEMLDQSGDPRLRTSAPTLIDAKGVSREGTIDIEGCAFDTDERLPWGRAVVAPGTDTCTFVLRWSDAGLAYPVLLDPAWTSAGVMSKPRYMHAAASFKNAGVPGCASGCTLAIGPLTNDKSVELFNEATRTWAMGPNAPDELSSHFAEPVGSGVIVGWFLDANVTYFFNPAASPAWTAMGAPPGGVRDRAAIASGVGRVVLAGGLPTMTSVDVFDGSKWFAGPPLVTARSKAGITLGSAIGKSGPVCTIVVAGGEDTSGSTLQSIEVGAVVLSSDAPQAFVSQPIAALSNPRSMTSGITVGASTFFFVSGEGPTAIGDEIDAIVIGATTTTKHLSFPHGAFAPFGGHNTVNYGTGFLAIGGIPSLGTASSPTADVVDGTGTLVGGTVMVRPRFLSAVVTMQSGAVMVTGGYDGLAGTPLSSAEIFELVPKGGTCITDAECGSRLCTDGVCCDARCAGQCQACNLPSKVGTCSTVDGTISPTGIKLGDAVTGFGTTRTACIDVISTCGFHCDGTDPTKCTAGKTSTTCVPASCTAGVETHAANCNGTGACLAASAKPCDLFACDTTTTKQCFTSCTIAGPSQCAAGNSCDTATSKCVPTGMAGSTCTVAGDCSSGLSCVDSTCCTSSGCTAPKRCDVTPSRGTCALAIGLACTTGTDCASGHCADGVCCDKACGGQCEACNEPGSAGTCSLVSGKPRPSRDACADGGANICAALACDGVDSTKCAKFDLGLADPCTPASCTEGSAIAAATCDGKGACSAPIVTTCTPYVCGDKSCKTNCASDADCASGYGCDTTAKTCSPLASTCSADGASSLPADKTKTAKECGAYRCDPSSGNCYEKCTASEMCGAGFVCDGVACVATASSDDSGGCAFGSTGSRSRSTLLFGALAALGLVSRRRRSLPPTMRS